MDCLREVDRAWYAEDGLYVLLWGTDETGAKGFLERLSSNATAFASGHEFRTAVFPDEGLTMAAVVDAVRNGEPVTLGQDR